jgi:protein CpxP
MYTTKATIVLGAILSTGMLMAQTQANPSQNASGDTTLSTQSAPQAAPQQGMGRQHEMNPNKQAHHLAKELGLSKDQVQQIEPILADRDQQILSLRGDANLAPQDRRDKMRSIQQESKAKIEAVLNDSQKQQFEQMLANRRAHHKGAQPGQAQPTQPGL